MIREALRVRTRRDVPLALALFCLPLLACFGPESVMCPTGLVCPSGQKCAARQHACIKDDCGDGVIQANEACDDGNILDGDGCSRTCKSSEGCGNSVVDFTVGEVCDDGNTLDEDGCSADCKSTELCGNSYVDVAYGERCDDGNLKSGDGCSDDCLSTEDCGNGYIDLALGEQCDDGNTVDGDTCRADCHGGAGCGNGYLDPGEQCDDGNQADDDDCLKTCRMATCGDGHLNTQGLRTEECDDGDESAHCNINCTSTRCGDHIVNASAGEQCDDGNEVDTDDCLTGVCQLARCGDGYKSDKEACDDGNSLACGTCDATCSRPQLAGKAQGEITAVRGREILDGETFSISDGDRRLLFEFNKTGSVPSSHREVRIYPDDDVDAVARAITAAIKDADLRIQAERNWHHVRLTHAWAGPIGNQPIIESVEDARFEVKGMSGGAGHDCEEGVTCRSNADCVEGLECRQSQAPGIGTCSLRPPNN